MNKHVIAAILGPLVIRRYNKGSQSRYISIHGMEDLNRKIKDPEIDLESVISVYLSKENLDQFPNKLRMFPNLVHIGVTDNNIKEIPQWISEFKELESIYIDGNPLNKIPENLGHMKKLKTIRLASMMTLFGVDDQPKVLRIEYPSKQLLIHWINRGFNPNLASEISKHSILDNTRIRRY